MFPSDLQGSLATWVSRLYGVRDVSVSPLDSPSGKPIYFVQTREQKWVLRIFPSGNEQVSSLVRLLLLFEQADYPSERLVRTVDHRVMDSVEGWTVVITTYVEGITPTNSPNTLYQLGVTLGRLHALPKRIDLPLAEMLPRREITYAVKQLESVAGKMPASLVGRYDELLDSLHGVHFCEDLPYVVIHNDCHPGNALYTPNDEAVFLDWEGAGLGPAVLDVGFLLASSDGRAPWDPLTSHHFKPDAKRVRTIVDGYCQYHTLSPMELECLSDAIRFRSIVYGACHFADRIAKGRDAEELQWWWTRLATADELAALARKHFEWHLENRL